MSLITLGVADVGRARRFYGALGWQEADASTDDIAFFEGHGTALAVWDRESLAEDSVVDDDKGGWGGITLATNVATQGEVDAILEAAEAAGGRVMRDGSDTFWGGYSGIFADPDGHRWEVASPMLDFTS